MYQPFLPMIHSTSTAVSEPKGVVYTKPWVVDLLLDLAGYQAGSNLVDALAVEPAAGEGAFLVPMGLRLIDACRRSNRPLEDCASSLIAFDLDETSVASARRNVVVALTADGVNSDVSKHLAETWVKPGDYLFESPRLPSADFVLGNPPYIRLEEIPPETAAIYRGAYPTMKGRADLYIAFFEAALRQLKPGGLSAFICSDRWMLNQYGAELRRFISEGFGVETIVEMHHAKAFDDEVSAYPAITVIRRANQSRVVVAGAGAAAESLETAAVGASLRSVREGVENVAIPGLTMTAVDRWFKGSDPWPCGSPRRLAVLRRIEDRFGPLETAETGTRVGIGVATGLDSVFITKDAQVVEPSRLLPLAMAQDTTTGHFQWSGHFLVNPWQASGLVDLADFPRLKTYLEEHGEAIRKRNVAQRNPIGWHRTIDRVNLDLTHQQKLYIPDIKDRFNPVLETGKTYPHHNLYYIVSERWNLEVLGGLLLSTIGQLFIESYGVRMRGGYLRFQAQYLRRVRVPDPTSLTKSQANRLTDAFRRRDRSLASSVAFEVYQVEPSEMELADAD